MKPIGPLTVLVVLLVTAGVASVAGAGYGPSPGIGLAPPIGHPLITSLAPTLSGTQLTGPLTLTYPNGAPVLITQISVRLNLCTSTGCSTVVASLTQVIPGEYTYSFTVPSSLSGAVSIVVPAGSLTDQFGTQFPNANTVIGTFTAGSSSSASAGSPLAKQPSTMRTTTPTEQTTQPQINLLVASLLVLLSIVGVALIAFPHRTS